MTVQGVRCIPSSDVSASEAAFLGVPLTTVEDVDGNVDMMVDVADELDLETLSYIVGRGENGPQANQPSLPRVRQLLNTARECVVVVDIARRGRRLGGSFPILIDADEEVWEDIAEELDDIFIGDAEIRRRSINPDAGPRGGNSPVITTDGNMVLDVQFIDGLKLFGEDESYDKIIAEIESVDGVLEHGLVVGVATKAVVGAVVGASGEDGGEEETDVVAESAGRPVVVQL
jgi:ribose 5-phosphate isomerase A